jgi:hypothetical protein
MLAWIAAWVLALPPTETCFVASLVAVADDPAAEAQAQLERAEGYARSGRYDDARNVYKRIVTKYAGTPAALIAAKRDEPSAFLGWADVVRNGPSKNRVDVVLMGDGWQLEHMPAFDKLAESVPPVFERQATFREYFGYLNFLRAALVSADAGVDGFGREYDTPLNAHTLGTFAGHVGIDHDKVMSVLAQIPDTDGLAIAFVKNGVLGTGGGGVACIGGQDIRTVIHEWGHAFGGLSDEYETQQSEHQGEAHDGINVSATDDPTKVPWAHWIAAKRPGIGVYEGAEARVHGAWKPTSTGCVMSSGDTYCVVCQEALVLRIYSIVDPIDSCTPDAQPQRAREPYKVGDEPLELRVQVMKPATHALEVTWWILSESRFPKTGGGSSRYDESGGEGPRDRRKRGPLKEIADPPKSVSKYDTSGLHKLVISKRDLAPGRYRVICRAKDTTKLRGDKWPWVLKDDRGLLESERGWWIEIPEK